MNAILLRTVQPSRSSSLVAFSDYREAEQANGARHSSVAANGALLEYETLELRVHPPNVNIDNDTYADRTLVTVDSANRPGTLVEVVQLLTELGLCVTKARISSDGGWFVDEFSVTDSGRRVTNERKLRAIQKVLSVDTEPGVIPDDDEFSALSEAANASTVFEMAGNDRIGLLADVIELLKNNGCEVRSAAVWTHNLRCAFVISVLDGTTGQPIKDGNKLLGLRQLLQEKMDNPNDSIVNVINAKGIIHYERRLHQLLLREEEAQWRNQAGLAARYEQEVAEQQALMERRFAGPDKAASGTATALAAGVGANGLRQSGVGSKPAPSGVAVLISPSSSLVAPLPHYQSANAAAAAVAAHVTLTAGSPVVGSPEGSVHGGTYCGGTIDGQGCAAAAGSAPGSGSSTGVTVSAAGGALAEASAGETSASDQKPAAYSCPNPSGGVPAVNVVAECPSLSATSSPSAGTLTAPLSPALPLAPPAASVHKPDVSVQHSKQHNYWTVSIRCRDRQKLLFDTVCTLADLNYDVYHGSVDCEPIRDKAGAKFSIAVQTFYMRPRYGDSLWDPTKAAKLKYMLECAIQRRHPQGTKVHIQGAGAGGTGAADLPALTAVWRKFGLCITRAQVRTLAGNSGEHTFYLADNNGKPPGEAVVQQACQQIGGVRVARLEGSNGQGNGNGAGTYGPQRGEGVKFGFTVYPKPPWGVAGTGSPGCDSI